MMAYRPATVVQVLQDLFYVLLQLLVVAAIILSFIASFIACFVLLVIAPYGAEGSHSAHGSICGTGGTVKHMTTLHGGIAMRNY